MITGGVMRGARIAERRCVMKTIALAVIAAAVCMTVASAQTAPRAASTKYYVTVDGIVAPVTGSTLFEARLTFSHDVQVPGTTLPAGTYIFALVTPNTMRITGEDRTTVYTTFTTTPSTRAMVTTHGQIRLERMTDGTTRLIGLYPDGVSAGYSPLYKKTHKEPGAPIATSGSKP
jgi:hypothetical protein